MGLFDFLFRSRKSAAAAGAAPGPPPAADELRQLLLDEIGRAHV